MTLRAHGLAVEAPHGWEVRIARRARDPESPGSVPRPVLHASTVPLPADRADFGDGVFQRLSPDDVFVALFEYEPQAATSPLFAARGRPTPTAADFSPMGMQPSLPGLSGRQWFFNDGGRAFSLFVVLGSHARRAALVNRLHPVLSTLTIDPRADA
jgi:hypothetical protein